MTELSYRFDGTRQSAHKAIRGNLEAMLAVFHGHVDEGDMLAIVKDVFREKGMKYGENSRN